MTEEKITEYRMFLASHFDLRLCTGPTSGYMYGATPEASKAADLYNDLASLQKKMVFNRKWYEAYSKQQMEDFERNRSE